MIIGKGGMGTNATEAMKKYVTVYGAFTGGAGALAAASIIDIEGVEWLDLGIPEALWSFKIKNFGPIIITIDSYGNNLHQSLMEKVSIKRDQLEKKL
jgi:tartrate/fumarate subfamily iron-sulfur-dependent hydro-lyase beta chain